jgi:hypothetical protein
MEGVFGLRNPPARVSVPYPELPHSDSIVDLVIFGEAKIVKGHAFMLIACKPTRNRVYSRLLDDGNDSDEGGKPDVLFPGSG